MRTHIQKSAPIFIVLCAALLLAWSVSSGWSRTESDFPSYHTAARMVRKGERLTHFYDMPYFQSQMDFNGLPNQLGGYIPQTPLTMLPFVPLTALSMQSAKRVWIIADVMFLIATVRLLARITEQRELIIVALLVVGFGSLYVNFLLGQYYIFLLFLAAAGTLCFKLTRDAAGGFLFGLICGLKLVTAPFCLYFAIKRQWRALLGMGAALALLSLTAVILFGWKEALAYASNILPRSLSGETLDPFNPANGTLITLLRRCFVGEPELNPNPLIQMPWAFFFFRTLLVLCVLCISLAAFARPRRNLPDLGGFFLGVLLLSPNTASYTFLLLLLPVCLLFKEANHRRRITLVILYFLVALPMRPAWSWLFPKVALLLILWVIAVVYHGRTISRPAFAIGFSGAFLIALSVATVNLFSYRNRVDQRWQRIAIQRTTIYSSVPAPIPGGLVYESIADGHYRLRCLRPKQSSYVSLSGDSFHPIWSASRRVVQFSSISNEIRRPMIFDPVDGSVSADRHVDTEPSEGSRKSPDGRWIVFSCVTKTGASQVFFRSAEGTPARQVTEGWCNSFAPAWELDSAAIVFASDCGRGVGLPALYRAPVTQLAALVAPASAPSASAHE